MVIKMNNKNLNSILMITSMLIAVAWTILSIVFWRNDNTHMVVKVLSIFIAVLNYFVFVVRLLVMLKANKEKKE